MESRPRITVFTPAYNRAHTLPRTYESLKKQSNKNFIWLIIDDGSTDNTKELVEQLTDNIYFAIEGNEEVNIHINLTNEVGGNTPTSRENRQTKIEEKQKKETRSPRPVNRNLRDLIKILLLRELLNRPGNRPPVRPPRPPFPGGPGRPPMRAPMMPRGLEDYNIYEV